MMCKSASISAPQYAVCLAGGIASGKSTVARICRLRGLYVYDCDSRARHITDSDPYISEAIARHFAPCPPITADGKIDRQALADIVFNNPEQLAWLNSLIHAEVRKDIARTRQSISPSPIIIETAIPVTSAIADSVDVVWFVSAPTELRLARACSRDNTIPEKISARIKAQNAEYDSLPPEKTTVIDNDGSDSLILSTLPLTDRLK